jgi:abnormal spindle-like microcephaly-associated protein
LLVMKQVRKEYQVMIQSVIKIQQFWSATIEMRKQKIEYAKTVEKIVFVQRKFRANLAMRKAKSEFQAQKSAAIVIQKRFRAQQEMKKCRQNYLKLKSAVLTVENRFLANRLMKAERAKFVNFVQTITLVQRTFRMKLEARKLRCEFKATQKSVLLIQTHSRGYLARRHFREHLATPENLEIRRQHQAARKIQAAWRGFKERSKKSNLCFRVIVQRLIKVSKNVDPTQTLASKLKMSLDFLRNRFDSNLGIATLAKLEYMSRTVPWILTVDAEFISVFCYGIMAQAIRSEVDKQVIELCSCIILNLSRYSATKEDAFSENGLFTIASMLLRWCDKDCGIFNTLCTLIWVFSHCEKKKKVSY